MQVYRIVERREETNLLQIYKPCCQWADHLGQRWGAVQYHVLEQARILEEGKDRQRRIHSGQDRSLEARRIERIDRFAEAKGTDDVSDASMRRSSAAQSFSVFSTHRSSAASIAACEKERVSTFLRFLDSAYVRYPKLDSSSLKL
jgi:hypothetical protein